MEELSVAMQNYLETIFILSAQGGGVRLSDIAAHLNVSKASANNAINVLAEQKYVVSEKYQEIYLTAQGKQMAARMEDKHSILKTLFIDVMGVPADVADRDACAIEHIISRETVSHIGKYLKNHNIEREKGH